MGRSYTGKTGSIFGYRTSSPLTSADRLNRHSTRASRRATQTRIEHLAPTVNFDDPALRCGRIGRNTIEPDRVEPGVCIAERDGVTGHSSDKKICPTEEIRCGLHDERISGSSRNLQD